MHLLTSLLPVLALSFVAQAAPVDSAATTTTSHSSRVVFRYQSLTSSSASSATTALSSSTSIPPTFYLAPMSTSTSSVASSTSSPVATSSAAASSGFSTSVRTRSTVSRATGTAAATPSSTVAPTVFTGPQYQTSFAPRTPWGFISVPLNNKEACLDPSGKLAAVEASWTDEYVWLSREVVRRFPFPPNLVVFFDADVSSRQYSAHGGLQKLCGKTVTATRTDGGVTKTQELVVTGGCLDRDCPNGGIAVDWYLDLGPVFGVSPRPTVSFTISS